MPFFQMFSVPLRYFHPLAHPFDSPGSVPFGTDILYWFKSVLQQIEPLKNSSAMVVKILMHNFFRLRLLYDPVRHNGAGPMTGL